MRRIATACILALTTLLSPASYGLGSETTNLLLNGGAEDGKGDKPSVWFAACVPAEGLKMARVTDTAHSGKSALFIWNTHKYDQIVCNNWAQRVQQVPKGKAIVLKAFIKAENADAVNVCVQCWDVAGKNMLAFESTPEFRGTQDWTPATSSPVVVPDKTASIVVRAVLTGEGKAWFDDVTLNISDGDEKEAASSPAAANRDTITKDCMVLAYLPDWSHGNVDNIAIANNDEGVRTLVACDPVRLTDEEVQRGVILQLALYSRKTTAVGQGDKVEMYEILKDWPELTSWQTQPEYAKKPAASFDFVAGSGWKYFNVTALVAEQQKEGREWHGVMLKFASENKSGAKRDWSGYAFVSREGAGEWEKFRPQLVKVTPEAKPEARSQAK